MHRIVTTLRPVVAAGLFLLAAPMAVSTAPAVADPSNATLPADPAAHGYIGLCDEAGRNISGGSVDSTPFVWKAVASQAPPKQYLGAGQNAVLTVFQPRPGVPANQWSGKALTSASFYAGALPVAQATYRDVSLSAGVSGYPAKVNGLYVLRMSFGKQNVGLYGATYPTTTIQVVGSQWRVVSGGTVDCAAATAKSNEQLTGVAGARDVTPRTPSSAGEHVIGHVGSSSSGAGSSRPASSTTAHGGLGPYTRQAVTLDAAGKPVQSSSSSAVWLWLLVPAVIAVAGGAVFWRRRSAR